MDKIIIKDLTVFANHGVLSEETALGQKFIVSAELDMDLHPAGISDDLSKSVNYDKICSWICKFSKEHPCKLIEAAAESLAEGILTEYGAVRTVRITLKKPWAPVRLPVDYVAVSVERKRHTAYIALGSNLGDRRVYLDGAVDMLCKDKKCSVRAVSEYIDTPPLGDNAKYNFLNGCLELETLYSPEELLDKLHDIENSFGRTREIHWGPRTLDLDIILYDDIMIHTPRLTIPHPEMNKRRFVLEPLASIAPYAVNPVYGKTVAVLLDELERDKR